MKNVRIVRLVFSFIIILSSLFISNARGSNRFEVIVNDIEGQQHNLYEESYALVIGASEYTNGWTKLPGVKHDIKAVSAMLIEQGFNVETVENPDHKKLERAFDIFIDNYGRAKAHVNRRLLFYFSGHGYTHKQSYGQNMGYIVPVDAPNPNDDLSGFLNKAMDMQQVQTLALQIQSKHALFVFDSCFSGSIFSLPRSTPAVISYKTNLPVRQFITSGSAGETVPDESIFAKQFVAAIKGKGDLNGDNYVTGTELGYYLEDTVVNYSTDAQHPQYGKIRNPNLDKGDFVFLLRNSWKGKPLPHPEKSEDPPEVFLKEATELTQTSPLSHHEKRDLDSAENRSAANIVNPTKWFTDKQFNQIVEADVEIGKIDYWTSAPRVARYNIGVPADFDPEQKESIESQIEELFYKNHILLPDRGDNFKKFLIEVHLSVHGLVNTALNFRPGQLLPVHHFLEFRFHPDSRDIFPYLIKLKGTNIETGQIIPRLEEGCSTLSKNELKPKLTTLTSDYFSRIQADNSLKALPIYFYDDFSRALINIGKYHGAKTGQVFGIYEKIERKVYGQNRPLRGKQLAMGKLEQVDNTESILYFEDALSQNPKAERLLVQLIENR